MKRRSKKRTLQPIDACKKKETRPETCNEGLKTYLSLIERFRRLWKTLKIGIHI